jgi:hypothetical protein
MSKKQPAANCENNKDQHCEKVSRIVRRSSLGRHSSPIKVGNLEKLRRDNLKNLSSAHTTRVVEIVTSEVQRRAGHPAHRLRTKNCGHGARGGNQATEEKRMANSSDLMEHRGSGKLGRKGRSA